MPQTDPARGARIGWVGLLIALGLGALAGAIAWITDSFVAAGAAAHTLVGGLVWLGVALYEGRRARARAERLEIERLAAQAREGRQALFGQGADALTAPQGDPVKRFVQVGVPVLTLLVAGAELGTAWGLWHRFPRPDGPSPTLPSAALLCLGAFVLLVLGRYGFALARGGLPSLAGGGRRASSAALALLLAGLALAAQHSFGVAEADAVGYLFVGVSAVLGVEALLLLLLEVYRPRRAGEEARAPYDSRLLGLLTAPSDLAKTIAHAVDYQFGFALSQTWFYRFLERWVVQLCGFTLLAFWLLSCFVVLQPHEQAVVRRFGVPRAPLGPGLHLKLPWPLEQVQRVESSRLHTLVTGHHLEDDHDDEHASDEEQVVVWTEGGHVDEGEGEALVLLARTQEEGGGPAPVNLLAASASVHYEVRDLSRFVGSVRDPHALLEVLAERELSFLLSGADLDRLLRDRGQQAVELQGRLQAAADAHGLGFEIVSASLTDLHPPVEVGKAFEEVTVALEESHAQVLRAEVDAARLLPRSRSEALQVQLDATLDARRRVALAKADAARFTALQELDTSAPELWQLSRLLDRFAEGAAERRKLVLGRAGAAVTDLDLQEKTSVEDIGLGQEVYAPRSGSDTEEED